MLSFRNQRGLWTPVITFVTPGNLAVAYSLQAGSWELENGLVRLGFNLITSTFTHTTAAGALQITGNPFTSANLPSNNCRGPLEWRGITKASYTQFMTGIAANASIVSVRTCGSGQVNGDVAFGDMPTGGTVTLFGEVRFRI
jgi:hypothetical protein